MRKRVILFDRKVLFIDESAYIQINGDSQNRAGNLQGEKESIMQSFEHVVQVASGLHARLAGELMRVVKSFKSDVILKVGEHSSNLQKVLEIMNLSIRQGDKIQIAVEGVDEAIASDEIYHFLKENL